MDERIDRRAMANGVERPDERRGTGTHHRQKRFNGLEHARDPPEGERGGAEADDLAVVRRGVAPDDVNRIGRGLQVIERAVEVLEPRTKLARPTSGRA